MTIKRILLAHGGLEDQQVGLATALELARQFEAEVEVFHAITDSRDAVAFVGEGMTSAMIEGVIAMAEKDAAERRVRARKYFDEARSSAAPELQGRLEFVEHVGREDELVGAHGRMFDLIVAARPSGETSASKQLTLEAALQETGRPVLIVGASKPKIADARIAIFWNGSVESCKAITAALPFLRVASGVVLFSVNVSADNGLTAADAVRYLAAHGITATHKEIDEGGRATGDALIDKAQQCGAELLVMGAFTHSRLRRLIFGAVTGAVIEGSPIAALMIH
ncbi:universal stress protein [Oceanibacterium hippocampi]|uniref:Universal stress protein family protein n=1 Tax=Oceanibacterium hippocampi TaxID=745714 RepID=A0A1Y5SE66_9PROT|nr:universal stress protein [Oceanibacterium hippocampi]SLN35934.1 Universal stress protein family protein [Oceanibacterium hippocampi]